MDRNVFTAFSETFEMGNCVQLETEYGSPRGRITMEL